MTTKEIGGLPPARLAAIVLFAAIAPSVLLMAPAIAAQFASERQFGPVQIGNAFSIELAAMSLATLPAFYWLTRIDRRKVTIGAALLFVAANVATTLTDSYSGFLAARALSALAGGTLMIISMASAAASSDRDRVYGLWVSGQLVLAAIGLWVLPSLFASFGLNALYVSLAALMLVCAPLALSFEPGPRAGDQPIMHRAASASPLAPVVSGVGAVLAFYVALSAVWTFIGLPAQAASLSSATTGSILAIASLAGIAGAVTATAIGARWPRRTILVGGYLAMALAVLLLLGVPGLARYTVAAILFKFTWTFLLPFVLASLADLDTNGRLMGSVNLVIGGGLAIGPALAGPMIAGSAGYFSVLVGSAVLLVVSMSLLLLVGRTIRVGAEAALP